MAITLVQSATSADNAGATYATSKAFTSNVTLGNLLVALFSCGDNGSTPAITIVNSAGSATTSAWTLFAQTRDAPDNQSIVIGYAVVTGSGSCTIQGSVPSAIGSTIFQQIGISEWAGAATSSLTDGGSGTTTTGATPTTPTVSPTLAGALIFAGGYDSSGTGVITGVGSGYTTLELAAATNDLSTQYQIQTTATPTSTNWLNSAPTDSFLAIIVAFKAASGPASPPAITPDQPLVRPATYGIDLRTFLTTLNLQLKGRDSIFGAQGQTQTYDWPLPKWPTYGPELRTWLASAQEVPTPVSQITDWPLPLGAIYPIELRTALNTLSKVLLHKDLFFGAAGQPVANLDQPASRPATYSNELRTHLGNALEAELASVPTTFEWPLPKWPQWEVGLGTFLNAVEVQLIGKDKTFGAAGQVFPNTDQPASPPAIYPSHLRTWLDSLQTSTLAPTPSSQNLFYAGNADTPLPKAPIWPEVLRTWLQWFVIDDNVPFVITDQPLVRGALYPFDLRTILNTTQIQFIGTGATAGQNQNYDWPLPKWPVYESGLRTSLGSPTIPDRNPHALYDWPLVNGAVYPIDLRSTIYQGLLSTLLAPVPKPPFYQTEHPLVRPAIFPDVLRTWLQTRFGSFVEPLPFALTDQPLTRGAVYPMDLRTALFENVQRTLLAPQPPPNLDQPLVRGAQYPFDLRTFVNPLSLPLYGKDKFFGGAGQPLANFDQPWVTRPVYEITLRTTLGNLLQTTLKPPFVGGIIDLGQHRVGTIPGGSYTYTPFVGGGSGPS